MDEWISHVGYSVISYPSMDRLAAETGEMFDVPKDYTTRHPVSELWEKILRRAIARGK
jgi:hypothetical protein